MHDCALDLPKESASRKKLTPRSASLTSASSTMVNLPMPNHKVSRYRVQTVGYCLTRQDEVLQCLDAHSARPSVEKKDVCRFKSCLTTCGPETKLSIILLLLLRWPFEDGRRLGRHDLRHFEFASKTAVCVRDEMNDPNIRSEMGPSETLHHVSFGFGSTVVASQCLVPA